MLRVEMKNLGAGIVLSLFSVFATSGCASAESAAAEEGLITDESALVTPPPDRRNVENVALGIPKDSTPSDDDVVDRPQYTLSYSKYLNNPNWAAWKLVKRDFGSAPRNGSFYSDPRPLDVLYRTRPVDYANSGYDQGHLCPSEQRSSSVNNNRATFFLSNVIPQKADANRGPWADFERFTQHLVQSQGRDLYILAGPIYAAACRTHKERSANDRCLTIGRDGAPANERIAIPEASFKIVAVVDAGAPATSAKPDDIIAVVVPNDALSSTPWTGPDHKNAQGSRVKDYVRTVSEIEAATGYTFLSALPGKGARYKDVRFDVAAAPKTTKGLACAAVSESCGHAYDCCSQGCDSATRTCN
jgi:endonuclease G, mitochondrial